MILSDFLPRMNNDNSNVYEIIPTSFNMEEVMHARYYVIHETEENKFCVQKDLKLKQVVQIFLQYMV